MQDIFVPHNWRWKLEDGRIWSTKHAAFVAEDEAVAWAESNNMTYIPPAPADTLGQHSEQGLREALEFYGLPLGKLATQAEQDSASLPVITISSDTMTYDDVDALGNAAYVQGEATAKWLLNKLGL